MADGQAVHPRERVAWLCFLRGGLRWMRHAFTCLPWGRMHAHDGLIAGRWETCLLD